QRIGISGSVISAIDQEQRLLQIVQAIFGSGKSFLRKVRGAAVVTLQQEEADNLRMPGAAEKVMGTGEKLFQSNSIPQRFAHFLALEGNHIIVHPVIGKGFIVGTLALGDLAFVMRK